MKKIKKKVALLLAMCMLAAVCSGCGQQTKPSDESKQSSESTSSEKTSVADSASESQEEEEEKEIFTIKHLSFNGASTTDHFNNYVKDSEVYKELVKQTRCEIEEYGLDIDQGNIRIASGELGDMIKVNNAATLDTMVESELLLPLNDLIAEYAPEILELEYYADVLEYAAGCYEDGNIYALPVYVGPSGSPSNNVPRYLYSVRWDLYKELGYPEMKTPDDLVEVLSDMVKLEPKTPEGKNVYGTSFYVTNTSFFGMVANFEGTYGFTDVKGHYIMRDKNEELVYAMIDEVGPYWMAVDYYNKAYRAGILDPDSFTQQGSDYTNKIDSGEILCNIYNGDSYNSKQVEKDPETIKGFVEVPVEGTMMYANSVNTYGWNIAGNSIAIPKSCENPQRVIEFIAYCFTEDGSRLLQSGVEGVHWDYVDGVPVYNEETLALAAKGSEDFYRTGIKQIPIDYFSGMGAAALHSDGYKIDLRFEDDYYSRLDYLPVQDDFCEYYGISYPTEIFQQYVAEGKMYDFQVVDNRVSLNANDEAIARIDSACMQIALTAIPKLVTAADDATFEKVKAETLSELKKAGAEEAKAYYVKEWEAAKAKVAE